MDAFEANTLLYMRRGEAVPEAETMFSEIERKVSEQREGSHRGIADLMKEKDRYFDALVFGLALLKLEKENTLNLQHLLGRVGRHNVLSNLYSFGCFLNLSGLEDDPVTESVIDIFERVRCVLSQKR